MQPPGRRKFRRSHELLTVLGLYEKIIAVIEAIGGFINLRTAYDIL